MKISIVDYWMIHRFTDALRHIGLTNKHEMGELMSDAWAIGKEVHLGLPSKRR